MHTKNKPCEEINEQFECQEQELDDEDKECVFFYTNKKDFSGACRTVLKNCAAYNKLPNNTEKGCKDFIDTIIMMVVILFIVINVIMKKAHVKKNL
jgi:hypothetical protein